MATRATGSPTGKTGVALSNVASTLPLRRDQKWTLYALLLLAGLVTLTAYACRVFAWKRGADLWLAGLLILAVGGVALWLAHRRK
ncbi:MAG: hypothetical protein U9R72_04590 [Chloroflexota bacterium]|nr:hypothetical protein [Chloroflexota bacterium]